MNARAQLLLSLADDELILGWRDSEWTGIAPTLEEDVAFSSIAQNEIGHARALYELAARRARHRRRRARVRPRAGRVPLRAARRAAPARDWAHTIARRYLYEEADRVRLEALRESDDAELAGLAAKIDREEVYHRLHAEMWAARLRDEPRFRDGGRRAVAVRARRPRARAARRARAAASVGLERRSQAHERGAHTAELAELWEEMTEVRRSVAGRAVVTADAGLGGARGDPRSRRSRSSRSSTSA